MSPGIATSTLELSAEEWMLLAQMGREAVLGELLARSSFPEAQTSRLLEQLVARGVIRFLPAKPVAPAAAPVRTTRTSPPPEGATLHFGSLSTLVPPTSASPVPGPAPATHGASGTLCFAGGALGPTRAASAPAETPAPSDALERIPPHLRHLEGLGFADTLLRPPPPATVHNRDAGRKVLADRREPEAATASGIPDGARMPLSTLGREAASLPTPEPMSAPPIATPPPERRPLFAEEPAGSPAMEAMPAGPGPGWPAFEAVGADGSDVTTRSEPEPGLPFTPPPAVDRERLRELRAPVPARDPEPAPAIDPALLEELEELEARAASGNLFRLLELPPGADPAAVKRAFHAASRRLHPDRFFHLGRSPERQRFEQVFRHLSEAHATLTDPQRRAHWEAAHPELAARPGARTPTPVPRAWDAEVRDAERRERFAQHPYLARASRVRGGVAQGRALLAAGDYQGAVETLSAARALEPGNGELASLLTEARERHAASMATREEAAGRAAEAKGDLVTALACYRRAATLDVRNASVAFRAASLLQKQGGDPREARLFAQRAVELAPDQAGYHHLLAQILIAGGARKLARRHLEEVLRIDPRHAGARGQLLQLRIGL